MAISIQEISIKIKDMETVHKFGQMTNNIKENGKMAEKTVKGH